MLSKNKKKHALLINLMRSAAWNDIYQALKEEAFARHNAQLVQLEKEIMKRIKNSKDWSETQKWMNCLEDVKYCQSIEQIKSMLIEVKQNEI